MLPSTRGVRIQRGPSRQFTLWHYRRRWAKGREPDARMVEVPDHIRASLHLPVEPLQGIVAPDLPPVLRREAQVGGHPILRVIQQVRHAGIADAEAVGDRAPGLPRHQRRQYEQDSPQSGAKPVTLPAIPLRWRPVFQRAMRVLSAMPVAQRQQLSTVHT